MTPQRLLWLSRSLDRFCKEQSVVILDNPELAHPYVAYVGDDEQCQHWAASWNDDPQGHLATVVPVVVQIAGQDINGLYVMEAGEFPPTLEEVKEVACAT